MNFNRDILLQIIIWPILYTSHILFISLPPHDISRDILLYVEPFINIIFLIPVSIIFFCISIFETYEKEDRFYNFLLNNQRNLLLTCHICLFVIFLNSTLISFDTLIKILNGELSLSLNDFNPRVLYSILTGIIVIIVLIATIGYYLHYRFRYKKVETTVVV